MILLNFAHPITAGQRTDIETALGQSLTQLHEVKTHFDQDRPFAPQVSAILDQLPLDAQAWQTEAIIINPPAFNFITAVVLAELHGRMGYFPAIIRLKPALDSLTRRFTLAEIINLQSVRDKARSKR